MHTGVTLYSRGKKNLNNTNVILWAASLNCAEPLLWFYSDCVIWAGVLDIWWVLQYFLTSERWFWFWFGIYTDWFFKKKEIGKTQCSSIWEYLHKKFKYFLFFICGKAIFFMHCLLTFRWQAMRFIYKWNPYNRWD